MFDFISKMTSRFFKKDDLIVLIWQYKLLEDKIEVFTKSNNQYITKKIEDDIIKKINKLKIIYNNIGFLTKILWKKEIKELKLIKLEIEDNINNKIKDNRKKI